MDNYREIDREKTGRRLKDLIEGAGYSVTDIQDILMLAYPQPIYRWFSGAVLPSVNHLYVLSRLLGMHMEDFLVPKKPEKYFTELARYCPIPRLTRYIRMFVFA